VFLCEQPNLIEKLIVEDISPSYSVSVGFPEYIAAMKRVSFSPSLKNIVHARKFAGEQLREAFPVISCLCHFVRYVFTKLPSLEMRFFFVSEKIVCHYINLV